MQAVVFRLSPATDLKAAIDECITQYNIGAAVLLSCIGSLQEVQIRFAGQAETTVLQGTFEILSLTGTLAASGWHLHIAVSDQTGRVTGGHFKSGTIYTTCELAVGLFTGLVFSREFDPQSGYKELVVNYPKQP